VSRRTGERDSHTDVSSEFGCEVDSAHILKLNEMRRYYCFVLNKHDSLDIFKRVKDKTFELGEAGLVDILYEFMYVVDSRR
jgi:hypothetical protein